MRKALLPLIGAILVVAILFAGIVYRDGYEAPWREKENSIPWSALPASARGGIRSTIGALLLPLTGDVAFGANSKSAEGIGTLVDEADGGDPVNTGEGAVFPEEFYFYRTLLSSDQKAVYNQVYANTLAVNREYFTLIRALDEEGLIQVVNAVLNDHPGLFWLDTSYSYGYLSSGRVVSLCLTFNKTADDLVNSRAAFDRVVGELVQKASALGSDVDREKLVHDYLMDYVSYDQTAPVNQSAYSALVGGRSVCAGYARAFQHVLMQLGIPCYYCEGTVDGGNHAWNIVKLPDGYYNVDASWDDAAGAAYGTYSYAYFNLSDEGIGGDHARRGLSTRLPACTATGYSYAAVYGQAEGVAAASAPAANRPTLESLGYSREDVITSLDRYYRYCRKQLVRRGTGTYTLTMPLSNVELLEAVYDATRNEDYIAGYAQRAADELKLSNCSIALQLSGQYLAEGYILLEQTVTLTGETAREPQSAAPPAPTPTPAAPQAPTPTPTPTAPPTAPAPSATPPFSGAEWPRDEGAGDEAGDAAPDIPEGFAPAA